MNISSAVLQRLVDYTAAIQQVPSPTFAETERAHLVAERSEIQGLMDVGIDPAGNVYARLPGRDGDLPPVVVSAHLDTVFPAETDLKLAREPNRLAGPGIGDNSLGVAGLLGLVWALQERQVMLPGDVWLVADVCEEGLGDLKGMKAVVARFAGRPLAYVVVEGMGLGQVFHRGLGVQRYRITMEAPGGHSWIDYGKPSAIHELAGLITHLAAMPLPTSPRTSLNVGKISGGTSVNTIAAQASLELDLRSEDAGTLDRLIGQVQAAALRASHEKVKCSFELIGQRPAGSLARNHPLLRLAEDCLIGQGIRPATGIGSTDANIPLSQGLPAICIGLTTGGGAHTSGEFIRTKPLRQGLEQLVQLLCRAWQEIG